MNGDHMPTVSVLLPTLNERATVVDCLESLLAQDYQRLVEILVVDGGSTDGTRDLVAAYAFSRPTCGQPAHHRRCRAQYRSSRRQRRGDLPRRRPFPICEHLRSPLRRGASRDRRHQRRRSNEPGRYDELR